MVTTMGQLQRHHLTDATLAVPSPLVVAAGVTLIGALAVQHVDTASQWRALAAQRDALRPELASGKATVAPWR